MAFGLGGVAHAAPGDILFSDDFDNGASCSALSPNWTTSNATNSGIGTHISVSGNCTLYTRFGVVEVRSKAIDLSSKSAAEITMVVIKGDDSFSELPDSGEDLVVQYLSSSGNWNDLHTVVTSSLAGGASTNLTLPLPFDALHSGFKLGVRQTGGSGSNYDYWHIDDIVLTEASGITPPPSSGTLAVGKCDDFESGLTNFTTSNSTNSGTSSQTYNSGTHSLFTKASAVTVTSIAMDSTQLDEITVWVRRGSDSFSENPEGSENLVIEALTNTGSWVALESFTGSGTQGQIFNRSYTPTAAMKHANFRIRFRQLSGSGGNYDYWHVDDLCLVKAEDPPAISVQKTSVVVSDPINGTTNPKAIPGALVEYFITVTNTGGSPDSGSVTLNDVMDPGTVLFVGNFKGANSPFRVTQGTSGTGSGLLLPFTSLGSTSDGVEFYNSSNSLITPVPDYDANVTSFEINFTGIMNAATNGTTPSLEINYQARLE